MTIFFTILTGVLVYVLGQLILKLLIEPVQELKREISKIVYDLIFHSNKLTNPAARDSPEMIEACKIMRQHSSLLHSATHLVPLYRYTHIFFGLPSRKQIKSATGGLFFLSNSFDGNLRNQAALNLYAIQDIKLGLKIPIPRGEYLNPEHRDNFIRARD